MGNIKTIMAGVAAAMLGPLSGTPALAGSVLLWPVDPVIGAGEKATALWIENKGDENVVIQVRTLAWSQAENTDRYGDQDEIIASPPIARIAPGKRQLIRIMQRHPALDGGERSYRLLIDELPRSAKEDLSGSAQARLTVQMRYSIPLFTYTKPREATAPLLQAHVEWHGGKRVLVMNNVGSRHARIVDLRPSTGGTPLLPGLVGYILPGQTMRWPLPGQAAVPSAFRANVNGTDQIIAPHI